MAYKILNKSMIKPIKGVLFDMDGVILDTEKLYSRFWQEAANKLGYPMTHEEALGLRSLSKTLGQSYLEGLFGKGISHKEIRDLRIKLMDDYINKHGVELKKGALELLDYLDSKNICYALTTSSPVNRIKEYLEPLNIYNRFKAICSGYEIERGKPYPDIYLYGAKALNLNPSECLAVEDSPAGILSAYRAKTRPVIIPDQDEPSEDILAISFTKADSLLDLISLIEELNQ